MNQLITELVDYGLRTGLLEQADEIYAINRLLELYGQTEYQPVNLQESRPLTEILSDLSDEALKRGLLEDDRVTERDLFDTKLMGILTPAPSVVRKKFQALYQKSPQAATDFYYQFSQDTNYIRTDRIAKDTQWQAETPYGVMDITINLSKPEKDPRDIAYAAAQKKAEYPKCLLCAENEGYAGTLTHPARQNHRIIPLKLAGASYYMQYSPYVYYNEHCIVFNETHTPMKIDRMVFVKLLDFVRQFPHYTLGSNADLPIVGGSILSHDHFQGGAYSFAMERAPYEQLFSLSAYPNVKAGIVRWPLSVIRLQSEEMDSLADAAAHILDVWRCYTDEAVCIFCETDGVAHNTITPIARRRGEVYELDLVLRNNLTTETQPWGVYHPREELHHIKKENIGLIEVMGLAVLPARLQKEMAILAKVMLEGKNLFEIEEVKAHADWAEQWRRRYELTPENIASVIQKEIADCFVQVLECAGVYARTAEGKAAFERFLAVL